MPFNGKAACELWLASYVSKHTSQSFSRPTFTHKTYISVLHTNCSRHSFSTLESCASSDWQATSVNIYCICFLVRHSYILQAQVDTTGGYNTTTHQMTPVLPRMLHSTLKASESYSLQEMIPCLHHCLIIVHNYMYVHVG